MKHLVWKTPPLAYSVSVATKRTLFFPLFSSLDKNLASEFFANRSDQKDINWPIQLKIACLVGLPGKCWKGKTQMTRTVCELHLCPSPFLLAPACDSQRWSSQFTMRVQYPMARPEQISRQKERGPDGALRHPYIRHPWRKKKKLFWSSHLRWLHLCVKLAWHIFPRNLLKHIWMVLFRWD